MPEVHHSSAYSTDAKVENGAIPLYSKCNPIDLLYYLHSAFGWSDAIVRSKYSLALKSSSKMSKRPLLNISLY